MMGRRAGTGAVLALCLGLAACDSGPGGPGRITVTATAAELGGAVLEVQGAGVQGFSARGSARVYSAAIEARANVHRVIVISPESGRLTFDIDVADLGMEGPVVDVVSAARADNAPMQRRLVTVSVER